MPADVHFPLHTYAQWGALGQLMPFRSLLPQTSQNSSQATSTTCINVPELTLAAAWPQEQQVNGKVAKVHEGHPRRSPHQYWHDRTNMVIAYWD